MREEVAQSEGFEFVVHLAVAGAGGELVLEPRAERGFEGLAGGRGAFGEVAKGAGKVLRENDAAIRDGDGVLEDVAEFADVAGPGVALEQFRGGAGAGGAALRSWRSVSCTSCKSSGFTR